MGEFIGRTIEKPLTPESLRAIVERMRIRLEEEEFQLRLSREDLSMKKRLYESNLGDPDITPLRQDIEKRSIQIELLKKMLGALRGIREEDIKLGFQIPIAKSSEEIPKNSCEAAEGLLSSYPELAVFTRTVKSFSLWRETVSNKLFPNGSSFEREKVVHQLAVTNLPRVKRNY